MKKFRKMFMSIMMVAISVTMLSTASFAWFAMSKEVKATTMDVEALTPGDILIHSGHVELPAVPEDEKADGTGDGGFTRVATAISVSNKLAPVSSADGLNFFFGKPELVGTSTGTPDLDVHDSQSNIEATADAYVQYVDTTSFQKVFGYPNTVIPYADFAFTLLNTSEQPALLVPSMNFVNTTYKNAMRASIHVVADKTLNDEVASYMGAGAGAAADPITSTAGATTTLTSVATDIEVAAGQVTYVVIRVWIEGGETNVTKENFRKNGAGAFKFAANFKLKNMEFTPAT